MALTPKQLRFVEEYLVDLNGTDAYQRAGYKVRSAASARAAASRLLANVSVQEAIAIAQSDRAERVEVTVDDVLRELKLIAHSNIVDYQIDDDGNVMLSSEVPVEAMRAVSSIKRKIRRIGDEVTECDVEIRLWPKGQALELIGRHLAMFTDKTALTDPTGTKEYSGSLTDTERAARIAALLDAARARRDGQAPSADSAAPVVTPTG